MWTQIKSGMEAPSKVIEKTIRAICRTSECELLADVMVCHVTWCSWKHKNCIPAKVDSLGLNETLPCMRAVTVSDFQYMIIMAKRIPNCNIPISSHILERVSVILSDMMLCRSSSHTLCFLASYCVFFIIFQIFWCIYAT